MITKYYLLSFEEYKTALQINHFKNAKNIYTHYTYTKINTQIHTVLVLQKRKQS